MAEILVDGYNALLAGGGAGDEPARAALVAELGRWRGRRGLRITVVFDSRAGGRSEATPQPGVRVAYAAGSADDAIVAMVQKSRSPRDILVVTSDRRLQAAARDLGARVEDVATFRARAARRRGAMPADKPTRLEPGEVEEWLELFSRPRPDDEP